MNNLHLYVSIVSGLVLFITIICTVTNNRLYFQLNKTIDKMNTLFKPGLILFHKPVEARFITTDELPLLKVWHNEAQNYGLFNIIGLISAIWLAVSVNVFHHLTYIMGLSGMMFLGFNLWFYPRAHSRLWRVKRMFINYIAMLRMLETIESTNDNREQSST